MLGRSVLQQHLVEAVQARSNLAPQQPGRAEAPDSFMGGLEVSEVPHSVDDDLTQGTLPSRDEAANISGWRR